MALSRPLIALLLMCAAPTVVAQSANIVIGNLRDVVFGTVAPTSGSLRRITRLCVGLDGADTYRVTATGSGDGGDFALVGGISSLPYSVYFSDRPNRRGQALKSGEPHGDYTTRAGIHRSGCRRRTSRLTITINDQDLQAMPSGRYAGTLTLMVSPE
jgi:hypothetical protein